LAHVGFPNREQAVKVRGLPGGLIR
jgi:hypothetical protein